MGSKSVNGFNLQTCARPNILALHPYRCARDDYKDDGNNVLLDANENAYGPGLSLGITGKLASKETISRVVAGAGLSQSLAESLDLKGLNRYPDPHQEELKSHLIKLRQPEAPSDGSAPLTPANLFTGVGSDEAIDNLMRCFCVPGRDKILTCPPTYGMYPVSATTNDVAIVSIPLDVENNFSLQAELVIQKLNTEPNVKMVFICSPGNPTSKLIAKEAIRKVLRHPTWNGIVCVDEAYIDFAEDPLSASMAQEVTSWPNLVVMQTLSKAFGLAGIRLGAAFASEEVAQLLNNIKAPYNVSSLTSQLAIAALKPDNLAVTETQRLNILTQRKRLIEELPKIEGIGRFKGGFDSNFLLTEILDSPTGKPSNEVALKVYETMAGKRGVVVRFRGKELGCVGCLRITVGTEEECTRLLRELKAVLSDTYAGKNPDLNGHGQNEEQRERDANEILA